MNIHISYTVNNCLWMSLSAGRRWRYAHYKGVNPLFEIEISPWNQAKFWAFLRLRETTSDTTQSEPGH